MSDIEPYNDPAPFGYRTRRSPGPNGEPVGEWIPLTADDLLDPQLGDKIPQTQAHSETWFQLIHILDHLYGSRADVLLTIGMKMLWGIPGLKQPSPDIAVILSENLKDDPYREGYDVVKEGARPSLIVEIVSNLAPELRRHDYVDKVEIYQRAGIPEYLILDPATSVTQGRLLWTGYRLGPDRRYRQIEPDPEGRLLSETTGLLFGVDTDGKTLVVIDSQTGEQLIDAAEWLRRNAKARKAAEAQLRLEADQRKAAEAELARLRAEIDRLRNR